MIVVVTINLMGAGGQLLLIQNFTFQPDYSAHTGVYGEAEFIFA